jgi:cell division protease FtsH
MAGSLTQRYVRGPRRAEFSTGDEKASRDRPWRVEGSRSGEEGAGSPNHRTFWLMVAAALLVINWLLSFALLSPPTRTQVSYTFFREQVQAANVVDITSTGDTIEGQFRQPTRFPPTDQRAPETQRFITQRPTFADDQLMGLLLSRGVEVNARPPDRVPLWQQVVFGFGPTILFVLLLGWLYRRSAAGGLGAFGDMVRSRAKLYKPESGPRTTFADVAGIDEVKNEVQEVVDFLKNPERYRKLGASIPKGVLLDGPPGTGKTLLARAVAGEAKVPFFFASASEFIEMIVGVGASRVRDLFDQAKKTAPAIIFIDELDAIGRSRASAVTVGGHDEREQTLNQILTEMDGFTGREGVVVLAATNRPEVLDPALLRPGRFDRRITVNPPDQTGRRQILEVHTRSVPLADDVDLDQLAGATPGMVGADLRNLVNESALLAARREHARVTMADFNNALEKVILGTTRKITMSEEEKRRTAYHEGGHALLGMLTPGADPVRKVSIIPRGKALGVTFQAPTADRYGYSSGYLRGRIVGALGGRAAEDLVFTDISTGAESDLEQATGIARQMVGRWGMSAVIGPMSVLPPPGQDYPFAVDGRSPAPATRELVDNEVRKLLDECHAQARETLKKHRVNLDRLACALFEHESLDAEAAYEAAGVPRETVANPAPAPNPADGPPPGT